MIVLKEIYAKYNNNVYRVSALNKSKVRLISYNEDDLLNGFKRKIYPENYTDRDILPNIFFCEVDTKCVDEIYERTFKVVYKNCIFELISNKLNEVVIGTSDFKLASKFNFNRTDKYYYEKKLPRDEVKIIEEQKNISVE